METVELLDSAEPIDRFADDPVGRWQLAITRVGVALSVPVLANRPLTPDPTTSRLVIVVQGDRRRPADYLGAIQDSGDAAGIGGALILAPHFRIAEELSRDEQWHGAAYWSRSGWKEGALSHRDPWPRAWRLSSFAVIDALLRAVEESGCWPGIRDVVLAGHSAGAQFIQRYAAGSTAAGPTIEGGVAGILPTCRYVVANPSSYLYLSAERPSGPSGGFEALTADELAACPGADRYKYGLGARNDYMARSSRAAIRERYRDRSVTYVVGELDNDPGDSRFDISCAGRLQGETRNDRGRAFHRYLGHLFGPEVYERHRLIVVPDVGHDVRAIFGAEAVRTAIFRPTPTAAAG